MRKIIKSVIKWIHDESALAAVEASFIFPIMLVMLLGTIDVGNAILVNQKTIRASQVAADLISRDRSVDTIALDEAIQASELALQPYPTSSEFGIDVISISFDDEETAQIVWRETRNMSADSNVLNRVSSLSEPNEGVVVVVIQYLFEPMFSGFVIGDINMQEVAFARGRKSAVVNRI